MQSKSSFGHKGKRVLCFAEVPPEMWRVPTCEVCAFIGHQTL